MKIKNECLPCLVNQVVKVAKMTNAPNQDALFQKVFKCLSTIDFNKTNPEIIGTTFSLLKQHIQNDDPYESTRNYYNQLLQSKNDVFEARITVDKDPLKVAIHYAILGNIIDFNPMHNTQLEDIMQHLENVNDITLTINHIDFLKQDLSKAKTLLYLGDNCGEICLDKLLLKQIKQQYPHLALYFCTRGTPVVNDVIEQDAYTVGINEYATIINNGDNSLGTVLSRTSTAFQKVYKSADVLISKGQANYESLSEEDKNIYFLLMAKCDVIANDLHVDVKSMICKSNKHTV